MEKLILISLGLIVLTSMKKRIESMNFNRLTFSTSSIGHPRSSGNFTVGPYHEEKPKTKKKENEDLNTLDEQQLLKEKMKLEKRLEKISKRLLCEEIQRLENHFKEVDNETND